MRILICNSKKWFQLNNKIKQKNVEVLVITNKQMLSCDNVKKFNPDYIFFVHWNWIVKSTIYNNYNCILFHTAPLPYGRGGSPIQNLILKGFERAPVCALKMIKKLDAGPIYFKKSISLKGSLSSIFNRLNKAVNCLIYKIITTNKIPKEQKGTSYYFKRLNLEDNRLPLNIGLKEVYDRVRMLDDADYPKAFIEYGDIKLEFYNAKFDNGNIKIKCKVSRC